MGVQDRRSVTGLKRAANRLAEKKECQAQAAVLKVYLQNVQMAEEVAPSNIVSCSTARIKEVCGMLEQESCRVPDAVKAQLVVRKVDECLREKAWQDLLWAVSPFTHASYDVNKPCVAGLQTNSEHKMLFFHKSFFIGMLSPLVLEGDSAASEVLKVCKFAALSFEAIDVVELDEQLAVLHDESLTIFRALQAILEPKLTSHERSEDCVGVAGSSSKY